MKCRLVCSISCNMNSLRSRVSNLQRTHLRIIGKAEERLSFTIRFVTKLMKDAMKRFIKATIWFPSCIKDESTDGGDGGCDTSDSFDDSTAAAGICEESDEGETDAGDSD